MFATRLVLSLAAVCLLGPLAAQAQKLPPDIAASKTVRVALNVGYPPLEMRDTKTNEIVGFDIDLARAMAKVLDVKLEWQDGAFEQMSPSLQSGRVDMIMSGFYDIPKRRGAFDFIDYLRAGAQFYVPKSAADLQSATDLCGKTITTSRGTDFPGYDEGVEREELCRRRQARDDGHHRHRSRPAAQQSQAGARRRRGAGVGGGADDLRDGRQRLSPARRTVLLDPDGHRLPEVEHGAARCRLVRAEEGHRGRRVRSADQEMEARSVRYTDATLNQGPAP